ncbi:MAG: hypothetical protein FJW30_16300 [Acidobacteria bacterium]|nr:hypothetical protein [Acidobacteriota bacterium]
MRTTSGLVGFCLLLGAFGADWRSQPFTGWSDDTVLRVLTDSPWAKPRTVAFTWRERQQRPFSYKDVPGADHGPNQNPGLGPLGGIGAPKSSLKDKADILVRWPGALPVRHATAVYKHREAKQQGSINERIGAPEQDYVVEMFGLPAELAHQGPGVIERVIQDSAQLHLGSGLLMKPVKVVALNQGLTLTIRVHFPRVRTITVKDKDAEFFADGQVFSVRQQFKLSAMMYQGHLEL